ncbi:MAG: class IV adenylate cyclase [Chloroflexota bacterium]
MNDEEIEVKFYVNDLARVEARLRALGATLIEPRLHETNLRFDRPDGSLRAAKRVLRLRQARETRLTYKGAPEDREGVQARAEIEFAVGDFESARKFLEALGYVQIAVYEKFRAAYELDSTHVMLDELPYGTFVEVEGAGAESIRDAATRLGLKWEAIIPASYLALFEGLCAERNLDPTRLTFDALNDLRPSPDLLHVRPADF